MTTPRQLFGARGPQSLKPSNLVHPPPPASAPPDKEKNNTEQNAAHRPWPPTSKAKSTRALASASGRATRSTKKKKDNSKTIIDQKARAHEHEPVVRVHKPRK